MGCAPVLLPPVFAGSPTQLEPIRGGIVNITALPDAHVMYSPETGEVTLGEITELRANRTDSEGLADTDSATIRMWVAIALYNPKAKPWRDGHLDAAGKRYPLSVFTNDGLVRLCTSSGTTTESASNDHSRAISGTPSRTSA